MCVCGLFLLDLFSFILAERGQEEKFYPVNASGKGKKKWIYLFSANKS